MTVRTPDDTHRTVVIARTGEGKSVRALDILSRQNFDEIPWIIIDYKGDPTLIDLVKRAKGKIKKIKITDKPPRHAGLYYMHPMPVVDDEHMEKFLWGVYKNRNTGLFIDEGYAMPKYGNSKAFTVILTQGRALHIPVICLYQRPKWMNRFAVAQSDFRCLMKLDDKRDEIEARQFVKAAKLPNGQELGPMDLELLPKYFSLWHDVGEGRASILSAAPPPNAVIDKIKARLSPNQHRRGMLV